jgi:hypothetical protein
MQVKSLETLELVPLLLIRLCVVSSENVTNEPFTKNKEINTKIQNKR